MQTQLGKFEDLDGAGLDYVQVGNHIVDSAEITPGKVVVSYWKSMPNTCTVFVVLKAPKDGVFQIAFQNYEGWQVEDDALSSYGISLNPGAKTLEHETDDYLFPVPGFDADTLLAEVKAAINEFMGYSIV